MPPIDQNEQPSVEQMWAEESAPASTSSAEAAAAAAPAADADATTQFEPASAPAQAAAAAPNPAATQPDPAQQLLEQLRSDNAALRREMQEGLRTVTGRVGALQSRFDKAQPTNAQVQQALKTPQGMQQLLKDFPEVAGPIQEFVQANLDGIKPTNPEELVAAIQGKLAAGQQTAVQEALMQREMLRVERAFPGWLDTVKTPEFNAWKAAQPPEIQALGASEFAEDALAMLTAYKKSTTSVADITARRQAVNAAAVTTRGNAAARTGAKSEDEMTDKEYFDHLAAVETRKRSTA